MCLIFILIMIFRFKCRTEHSNHSWYISVRTAVSKPNSNCFLAQCNECRPNIHSFRVISRLTFRVFLNRFDTIQCLKGINNPLRRHGFWSKNLYERGVNNIQKTWYKQSRTQNLGIETSLKRCKPNRTLFSNVATYFWNKLWAKDVFSAVQGWQNKRIYWRLERGSRIIDW